MVRTGRNSGTLQRQFKAPCSVSSKHPAASVQSTLQRQFKAPWSVSSKHPGALVQSTLERQFKAPWSVSSNYSGRDGGYAAIASISTRASLGSRATWTVARAG
jgi:hypothetical protein